MRLKIEIKMASMLSGTHSIRFIRALAEEGLIIFSTKQAKKIAENLSVPSGYVANLLMIMERNGWITKLRRGFYIRSAATNGGVQVHPFAIATAFVKPSAISHWSALHHYGLTEQIPRVTTAFTYKKVVTPSMRTTENRIPISRHAWIIEGIRYEFTTVKEEHFFGIEDVWVDEFSRVPITDKERTVLETFISPNKFGGIGEGLGIMNAELSSLDIPKLVEYALRYNKISVAKRIGWTLENAGIETSILEPLLNIPATGYHALDPTLPHKGPCDSRWMIQNNTLSRRVSN